MTRPRSAALKWVEETIAEQWPAESSPKEMARTLVAAAENHGVPI